MWWLVFIPLILLGILCLILKTKTGGRQVEQKDEWRLDTSSAMHRCYQGMARLTRSRNGCVYEKEGLCDYPNAIYHGAEVTEPFGKLGRKVAVDLATMALYGKEKPLDYVPLDVLGHLRDEAGQEVLDVEDRIEVALHPQC